MKRESILRQLRRGVEYDLTFSDRKGPGGMFINSVDTVGFDGKDWYWISSNGLKSGYSDSSRFRYELGQELMSSLKASRIMERLMGEYEASLEKVASRVASRYARIANRIAINIQENADRLSEITREIDHVPGVEAAMLDDYDMFRPNGKIRVELPVKEWSGGYEDRKPTEFGIEPRMLADRISAKLRNMGVRVMDVIYPREMRGMFGKMKGYDSSDMILEVSFA
jgi:hypothetical protein